MNDFLSELPVQPSGGDDSAGNVSSARCGVEHTQYVFSAVFQGPLQDALHYFR